MSYKSYQPSTETFQYSDSRTGQSLSVNFTNFFNITGKNPKIYLLGIFLLSISLLITYWQYKSYMKENVKDYRVINSYHITIVLESFLLISCIIMGIISFFKVN
jgi:hypothetical protein